MTPVADRRVEARHELHPLEVGKVVRAVHPDSDGFPHRAVRAVGTDQIPRLDDDRLAGDGVDQFRPDATPDLLESGERRANRSSAVGAASRAANRSGSSWFCGTHAGRHG